MMDGEILIEVNSPLLHIGTELPVYFSCGNDICGLSSVRDSFQYWVTVFHWV